MSTNKWNFHLKPSAGKPQQPAPSQVKRPPQSRASVLQAQQHTAQMQQLHAAQAAPVQTPRVSVNQPVVLPPQLRVSTGQQPQAPTPTNSQMTEPLAANASSRDLTGRAHSMRESVGPYSSIAPTPLLRGSSSNGNADFDDYIQDIHERQKYSDRDTRDNRDTRGDDRDYNDEVINVNMKSRDRQSQDRTPSLSLRKSEKVSEHWIDSKPRSDTKPGQDDSVKKIQISPTKKTGGTKKPERSSTSKSNYRQSNSKKQFNGWVKTEPSRQDEISEDAKEFGKRFEGYIEIKPEEYATIQPDTWIRYMKHNPDSKYGYDYRSGGKVVKNKFPDYWILKPTFGNGKNWFVQLQSKNRYFRKVPIDYKSVNKRNANLYDAVQTGTYMLMTKQEYEDIQAKLALLKKN
jgi:hypothetical protein